jgi:hypothetical protein
MFCPLIKTTQRKNTAKANRITEVSCLLAAFFCEFAFELPFLAPEAFFVAIL